MNTPTEIEDAEKLDEHELFERIKELSISQVFTVRKHYGIAVGFGTISDCFNEKNRMSAYSCLHSDRGNRITFSDSGGSETTNHGYVLLNEIESRNINEALRINLELKNHKVEYGIKEVVIKCRKWGIFPSERREAVYDKKTTAVPALCSEILNRGPAEKLCLLTYCATPIRPGYMAGEEAV